MTTMLVTGATGYVGSRLVPTLLEEGYTVLAATRDESRTDDFPWGDDVQPQLLDVADDASVRAAVEGVDVVVYLVRAMDSEDVESLVESLSHDMVCREDDVRTDVLEPGFRYTGITEALRRSLTDESVPGSSRAGDVQASAATDPA